MILEANIIDIRARRIFFGAIEVKDTKIVTIRPKEGTSDLYLLPGFIDAHIHIESSMLVPSEFARLAVLHGTVATVSDPHEIANVLGVEGVQFMIENGKTVPLKFNFGAPSCVPATSFETAGAILGIEEVQALLELEEVRYLAEMMNYPGVLNKAPEVLAKIAAAAALGKPIDGHAPGLRGAQAKAYIEAGISTDHECFSYEEGKEKLEAGMKVIIREGSAAKNFKALIDLLPDFPDQMMFCSDDKHPDDLLLGHINKLVARAIQHGCDLFDVLKVACLNPVEHYQLPVGQLQVGDPADFILVDSLETFNVMATYINGECVAKEGKCLFETTKVQAKNNFNTDLKQAEAFDIPAKGDHIRVIKALDGELITGSDITEAKIHKNEAIADIDRDILKMTVVNRYQTAKPAMAFINGFGIRKGAIASCVGHDSHNIIAVGADSASLSIVVNAIIRNKGGIAAYCEETELVLPLPVAGIMSTENGETVGKAYAQLDQFVKNTMGCKLSAPFMTLSFMALLVIPTLKLSDKGLFDGKSFTFVSLFP